jgi:DNA invertase Pin-like site-specific DNA recombinase
LIAAAPAARYSSEFETNLRRERQLEGILQAKAKGVYGGRRPIIDVARVFDDLTADRR